MGGGGWDYFIPQDAYVKFMHPPEPSYAFFWPQKVDACWVPFHEILCEIATPTAVTGRSHSITPDCNAIVNAYTNKQ